jgi:hypothetical protein
MDILDLGGGATVLAALVVATGAGAAPGFLTADLTGADFAGFLTDGLTAAVSLVDFFVVDATLAVFLASGTGVLAAFDGTALAVSGLRLAEVLLVAEVVFLTVALDVVAMMDLSCCRTFSLGEGSGYGKWYCLECHKKITSC